MARLHTYATDSSIAGSEKLLGTDSGTTKLFSLSDLSTYFTHTVTLTGSFGADLLPDTDGTYDLGSTTYEWEDLWIDGTANIDSLVADTADINAGNIDGTIIDDSSAAAGTFTTATASTINATRALQIGGTAISLNSFSDVVVAESSLF